MKKNYLLSFVFLVSSASAFAQTKEDVSKITENYDLKKINSLREFHQKKDADEKRKAEQAAIQNNWPIKIIEKDGSYKELMRLTPDGFPLYFSTDNAAAAKSTRANHLHTGGSLGLNLNGENMVARVWDGGIVRRTHNSFSNRVTTVDDPSGTTYNFHATHVTGTIMASDLSAATKGMAWKASARTFEWTNDISEVLTEIQGGMLISNHSYGVPIISNGNPIPAWYIGAYTQDARNWDEVAYLAPYYLMVASAGNNGLDENNEPLAGGYDKLTGNKVCKNNLVVANAQDASVDTAGNLTAPLQINTSSSQGPTDDLRIKPDITGNGTGVTSTGSASNTATQTLSGTSMASPNVAGTILLLQQHYKNLTNGFMKAATLKALVCQTADDAGNTGPDAVFGWGLLNAKRAAQAITDNGLNSWVSEQTLSQGETFTTTVRSNGSSPLIVGIAWTDLPGVANNGTLPTNDPTPALVNDLDIRVTRNGTTYYPWRLVDPTSDALRDGDNSVDNVEQVEIDAPTAGDYTVTISHKGNLSGRNAMTNGKQEFSFVVSGANSVFALVPTSTDALLCANQNAVYTFNYKQTGGGTTTFSAVGLPAGAVANFTPSSLSANGTVTATISNLSSVVPGEYNIGIVGNNGTETETRYRVLKIFNSTFQPTVLTSPAIESNGVSTSLILTWNADANAESYNLQVATDPNFTLMVANETVTINKFLLTGLNEDTVYFWRVVPSNRCGAASASNATVFNFKTGLLVCGNIFDATDYSNAYIADTANATATVPVDITGGLTIGEMKINLNISHIYVQDMTIWLEGPAALGSPTVTLIQEACGGGDNIICTVEDSGGAPTCSGNPNISGSIAPLQPLSNLNGLVADGTWVLHVDDPYATDGGSINSVSIEICNLTPSMGVVDNEIKGAKVYPNPTKGILNISLPQELSGDTQLKLMDVQGRNILSKTISTSFEVLNIENLQGGVYMLSIENNGKKTTKKIVLNR
ncbi:S8 family serine peptidase [Flavobacterium sp. SM15]|uniref:S8 family serine peptidase n=1 Tax=Flavobacterium sp. SM15 TaxID=2908005 RepID=UPI001EDC009E|nr:S8 family serine peptidase [Flavobacterium sp. SM15]MCG2610306.1 S8 family serine peptidase [Flavobacterium sp. SM15]